MIKFSLTVKLSDDGRLYINGKGDSLTGAEALTILHCISDSGFHIPDDVMAAFFSIPAADRLRGIGKCQEATIDLLEMMRQEGHEDG